MVLPSGVNKATGLAAALDSLGLSPHNAVGVGDAENDHAFLALCECAVAVAGALPSLKAQVDVVTAGDAGAGVRELIDELLADDLSQRAAVLARHRIPLGTTSDGRELAMDPCASGVLIAGTSGSGKSTVAKGLLERLAERGYSYAVIDPEGDYAGLEGAVTLGTTERAVGADEAMQLLERRQNAVLNLVGLPLADRPSFFLALLPRILALRARTGQPHWLIVDEAHHLMPTASQAQVEAAWPDRLGGVALITVHPQHIAARALRGTNVALVVGKEPVANLREFAGAAGHALDLPADGVTLESGEALTWMRDGGPAPLRVKSIPSRIDHRRHVRKYAQGELPLDRSFHFRGPDGKLNLRAQNLVVFLQIGDGVDDDTWLHHLKAGDYSRWIAEGIKDDALAQEVQQVEAMADRPASQTRALVREAIERLYTLPS
jgi:hypothetical protein